MQTETTIETELETFSRKDLRDEMKINPAVAEAVKAFSSDHTLRAELIASRREYLQAYAIGEVWWTPPIAYINHWWAWREQTVTAMRGFYAAQKTEGRRA
jgi:hypothetical protein